MPGSQIIGTPCKLSSENRTRGIWGRGWLRLLSPQSPGVFRIGFNDLCTLFHWEPGTGYSRSVKEWRNQGKGHDRRRSCLCVSPVRALNLVILSHKVILTLNSVTKCFGFNTIMLVTSVKLSPLQLIM